MVWSDRRTVFDNLEGLLFIKREVTDLKPIDLPGARVEHLTSSAKSLPIVPLVIGGYTELKGVKSGLRSALVPQNGHTLKIKGCALEYAFVGEGPYTLQVGRSGRRPYGGMLLPQAHREAQVTSFVNRLLAQHGFPAPYEPAAIIHYGREFVAPRAAVAALKLQRALEDVWNPAIRLIGLGGHQREAVADGKNELAAIVMLAKGDTRLPELYGAKLRDDMESFSVVYRLGIMAGAQKRITEGHIQWDVNNSHIGNYVLFNENEMVWLGMCDFDFARGFPERMEPSQRLKLADGEFENLLHSLSSDGSNLVYGADWGWHPSDSFKAGFHSGLQAGYRNPDNCRPIPLGEFCSAFGLESKVKAPAAAAFQ